MPDGPVHHESADPELEAVLLLTRAKDEPYEEYIERVATVEGEAGQLARVVKLADLRDNLGRARPEMEDLRKRYEKAIERLEAASLVRRRAACSTSCGNRPW